MIENWPNIKDKYMVLLVHGLLFGYLDEVF